MTLGAFPVDPSTTVGAFRLRTGDATGVEVPDSDPKTANYGLWSDAEIEAFLSGGDSISRAIAGAYRQLAAVYAQQAITVVSDDLRIQSEKRAEHFRDLAKDWDEVADREDKRAASEIFEVYALGSDVARTVL